MAYTLQDYNWDSDTDKYGLQTSFKKSSTKVNMFDILLKPSASSKGVGDEVDRYLATDKEEVANPLLWWWERRSMYLCLS